MISDVLFDAIEKIERYQREMPEIYVDDFEIAVQVEAVKLVMRALQSFLDTPPLVVAADSGVARLNSNS